MRLMGIDLGRKRIGIALSDELGILAQGKTVIQRTGDDEVIDDIENLINENGVSIVILGLPLNMDGSKGERAKDSEEFALRIKDKIGIDVLLWDERLSTKEAEDVMIKGDMSRRKRKAVIDKMAAQLILQGYLDSLDSENELK